MLGKKPIVREPQPQTDQDDNFDDQVPTIPIRCTKDIRCRIRNLNTCLDINEVSESPTPPRLETRTTLLSLVRT